MVAIIPETALNLLYNFAHASIVDPSAKIFMKGPEALKITGLEGNSWYSLQLEKSSTCKKEKLSAVPANIKTMTKTIIEVIILFMISPLIRRRKLTVFGRTSLIEPQVSEVHYYKV
jgi:hypothetical protein